MGDSDSEDYIAVGTPLEREREAAGGYKKKPQDPGATKSLPVWQQEVTDEEGRRRFHGAGLCPSNLPCLCAEISRCREENDIAAAELFCEPTRVFDASTDEL